MSYSIRFMCKCNVVCLNNVDGLETKTKLHFSGIGLTRASTVSLTLTNEITFLA